MGKKNRNKDKSAKTKRVEIPFNERPFAGYAIEEKLIALREFLPTATMEIPVKGVKDVQVIVCTALPSMISATVVAANKILVSMQARSRTSDASHDLALGITTALEAARNGQIGRVDYDVMNPAVPLADLLDPQAQAELKIENSFEFWLTDEEREDPQIQEMLKTAKDEIIPTEIVAGTPGAYFTDMGKLYLRWVRTDGERDTLDALSRLHSRNETTLGKDTKLIGVFRVGGLLVPVWQLPAGTTAAQLSAPLAALDKKFTAALGEKEPLDAAARRAKAGLINRQVAL